MLRESILFIGPMGVGKSSVAKEISAILGLDYVDVDEDRWDYFAEQPDYDRSAIAKLFNEGKGQEAFRSMKPFEARYAVAILSKYPGCVLDFGAGYSVHEDMRLFEQVRAAFSKYKHVVFLRYSDDPIESLKALQGRHPDAPEELFNALNKEFIESPCNEMLATHIIDTKNKSVQEVVALVLQAIEQGGDAHDAAQL